MRIYHILFQLSCCKKAGLCIIRSLPKNFTSDIHYWIVLWTYTIGKILVIYHNSVVVFCKCLSCLVWWVVKYILWVHWIYQGSQWHKTQPILHALSNALLSLLSKLLHTAWWLLFYHHSAFILKKWLSFYFPWWQSTLTESIKLTKVVSDTKHS